MRVRVTFTSAGYRDADGNSVYADHGAVVDMSDAEAKRLLKLGAVEKAQGEELTTPVVETPPAAAEPLVEEVALTVGPDGEALVDGEPVTEDAAAAADEDLMSMSRDDLVALADAEGASHGSKASKAQIVDAILAAREG